MPAIITKAMLIVRRERPERLSSGVGETRTGKQLLFSRGYDSVKKQAFLRLLGGHVEFGETGEQTIKREMQEEVGCNALDVKFLSAIENIFTYNGKEGHEIILVYEGRLSDTTLYEKDRFMFQEGSEKKEAGWYSRVDVEKEGVPIYPPFNYF